MENLDKLVRELMRLPNETQWVEFKYNNYEPKMIGQDISALSNGAALMDKDAAYFVWGIDNETHEIVGTTHNLQSLKKGNQELENWLRSLLSPHADFEYQTVVMDEKTVGVMRIRAAINLPVTFEKQEYVRVGSYTKPLREYPALQSRLWNKLQNKKFEEQIAQKDLSMEDVLSLLCCEVYFNLLNIPMPSASKEILHFLESDDLVVKQDNGLYGITNLGAILLAKKIGDFPRVARKALRVIQYEGKNKLQRLREKPPETSGYAVVYEEVMRYISTLIPAKEIIENGIRKEQMVYANQAVREIVANALIHQDFSITGAGPMVEIFSNRIEITNPGRPLVDVLRIVDTPPRSRNEKLSALMRRMGVCEESGTGWDKSVIACEIMRLPAPRMDVYEESTRVTLLSETKFSDLSTRDRIWGCYLHACIKYIQGDYLTNSSFRARFGLKSSSSGMVSRIIKETVNQNLIRPFDQDTAPRYMKYLPTWG
ncbi:ATP-binding protein [Selenomonas ruminantium]|uniref:ATP-binding protein n=1 Tax=Selenomonas ruminantium TaxID=971 RepID=UPI0026EAC3B9|nr:ATP-binding protein [Selenomonas ruminantium]